MVGFEISSVGVLFVCTVTVPSALWMLLDGQYEEKVNDEEAVKVALPLPPLAMVTVLKAEALTSRPQQ